MRFRKRSSFRGGRRGRRRSTRFNRGYLVARGGIRL